MLADLCDRLFAEDAAAPPRASGSAAASSPASDASTAAGSAAAEHAEDVDQDVEDAEQDPEQDAGQDAGHGASSSDGGGHDEEARREVLVEAKGRVLNASQQKALDRCGWDVGLSV